MNPDTQDAHPEPSRESRIHWFLIAIIVLLSLVIVAQGGILFKLAREQGLLSKGRAWHDLFHRLVSGQPSAVRPQNSQVVFWEPTDDLEQIHDQIRKLLHGGAFPLDSSMAGGPFPGVANPRESGTRPPAMLTSPRDWNQLQREIERIFESAYNDSLRSSLFSRLHRGWEMVPTAAAMNIEDRGTNYAVTVALPGYDKEGITVRLEGRMLIIGATRPAGGQPGAAGKTEGRFYTQMMMPENISHAEAQAEYQHDVLSVYIPKTQETNTLVRAIAIR